MAAVKLSRKGKPKVSGGTVGSYGILYTLGNEKPTPTDDISSIMISQFGFDSRPTLSVFLTSPVYSKVATTTHTHTHT